jgi:iron complex outermembrane receptor protein
VSASAVLTFAAASAAPQFSLGAQDPVAATVGSLVGRVTESPGGGPIAGARVQALALPGRATAGSAVTGPDGRFRVGGLRAGPYAVVVTRIGYQLQRVDTVRVADGAAATADVALTALAQQLDVVVTTASRGTPEKALEAPASISVVTSAEVERRAAVTTADLVRATPGVDATQGGVAQTNIVVRGFNNAFSGSLLMLQDYRFAGVPSLRVNVPLLTTGTTDDIERVEVLLGPASALYGPNSANGVLHVITKSPFNSVGTSATVDGGERSIFRGALRHAGLIGQKAAFKVSGEYFRGRDFQYADPAEPDRFPDSPLTPQARRGAATQRDFDIARYSGEARVDVRPADETEFITTLGYTNVGSGIELTGANGASQIRGWTYANLQQRFRHRRLFAQVFANVSDAGNRDSLDTEGTYLRRSGQPIVDQSRVYSAQLQHGFALGGTDFVYGGDYIRTDPRTGGTINGRNEDRDRVNEYGAYLQTTTRLAPKFDLLAAARVDGNNVIAGAQFSPRAALVFKPTPNHNFRATYGRAFSTPANFSFFLDLVRQPLGGPYNVRAVGNPPKEGFDYRRGCAAAAADGLCMRSPFTGGGEFVAAGGSDAYAAFVGALGASLPANNTTLRPLLPALGALRPAAAGADLSVVGFPSAAGAQVVAPASLRRIAPLQAQFNNTYEVGYKGIFASRARLAVDLWYQQRSDVGTPAQLATPGVFMNRQALGQFVSANLAPVLQAGGLPAAQAAATAAAVGQALTASPDLAPIFRLPLGVVTFDSPLASRPTDFLATYQLGGQRINLYGTDVAVDFLATDRVTLASTYSYLSQNVFRSIIDPSTRVPFMSNSPRHRASLTGRYEQPRGWGFELRGRYADAFPVNSAVYVSGVPLPVPGSATGATFQYPDVPVNAFVDAGITYRTTIAGRRALLALNGTNILDNRRASFVGVPEIGRLLITRVKYDF